MKKILSKMLILFVIAMMTTAILLTACGTKKPADTSKSNTADLSAPGTLPIVKTKITLKALAVQIPVLQDIKTNEFTKYWEEKTNIHIEWQMIPSDAVAEKVNLIMASGDLPDVFYGVGINDVQESKYGVGEKLIIPLDDLIKTQTPNFNKLIAKYPVITGAITNTDGKIYSMPQWNDCFHCSYQNKMWMNQTWLDKLSLKQPETTDDFYNVLKAFKTKDPNGNGKADEIPLAGSIDGWNGEVTSFIMNAFIFDGGMWETTKRYVKNNVIDTSANKPEYKEGLKYLNKLYKEGLMSKASFTQKNDQVMQLAANPDATLLGATPNGASVAFVQAANQKVYRQFQAIAPLKGPAGVKQTPFYKYSPIGGGSFAISKTCKYPEAALRMYDMLYDFGEVAIRHGTGVPDKEWRFAKAGEVGINGKPAIWKMLVPYNNTDPQNSSHMWLGGDMATAEHRLGLAMDPKIDPYTADGMERMLYDVSKNNYEPYASKDYTVLPPIKLLDAESQDISTTGVELGKFITESRIKFIIGEQNIDANWDKYVKNLDSIGLKKYLEVYQKGYDRQYKDAK